MEKIFISNLLIHPFLHGEQIFTHTHDGQFFWDLVQLNLINWVKTTLLFE